MKATMLEHVADRKVMVAAVTQSTTAQVQLPIYTQVCGRMTGYPYATIDGIVRGWGEPHTPGNEINGPYLDGVSVTYGTPRQHIWSFFCGRYEGLCCNEADFEVVELYNICR